jgi:hypothetical protein
MISEPPIGYTMLQPGRYRHYKGTPMFLDTLVVDERPLPQFRRLRD